MTDTTGNLRDRLAGLLPELAARDGAALTTLAASARRVALDDEDYVFRAGDACGAFLILLEGRVRVQLTSAGGREVTLYRIGPGGSCLLTTSCLLGHEHYPADAIAETAVVAVAIPERSFRDTLDTSRYFRDRVFDGFSARLANVIGRVQELVLTSIDTRLAAALLAFDAAGVERLTHQQLAVELGTAREVVTRHLKYFQQQGWVRLARGRISVEDRDRLSRLAAGARGD